MKGNGFTTEARRTRRDWRLEIGDFRPQSPLSNIQSLRVLRASVVKSFVLLVLAAGAALTALAWPRAAAAHPLGNFTVNRYARVEQGAQAVRVVYALEMAEIPTFQESGALDRDRDGNVSEAERSAYLDQKLPEMARNLNLSVNGAPLALRPESGALSLADGQGGLKVLRIDAGFVGELPGDARSGIVSAQFRDTNYDNRLGWKEIVVRGTSGAAVRDSTVPAQDLSDALRAYPEDALQSPPEVREARFSFEPGAPSPDSSSAR